MNNPKMSGIIDRLSALNSINEGVLRDKKELNRLSGELEKFLSKKKVFCEDIGVDRDKIVVRIDGDWKHDHLYFKDLANDFFNDLGKEITIKDVVTRDSQGDTYEADHYIEIKEGLEIEVEDTNESYNAYVEMLNDYMGEDLTNRLRTMLKKFSDTPLDNVVMSKVLPDTGLDFVGKKLLITFVLNDGLSTDDFNKGVVTVLTLPKGLVHLIDTEILEDGLYYKNTILYNLHELELMSKEVWMGEVE